MNTTGTTLSWASQLVGSPAGAFAPVAFARDLKRAKSLATWLDTRFSFMGYRFGFETIAGLLPVGGDTATALLGLFPVWVAASHRLGRGVIARMVINLIVEWVVGIVPILGDLFDTVFKANVRNAKLLENEGRRRGAVA